jgi:hypothetical protein
MAETKRLAMTKRDAGRGTGDGVKWEGEAPAEPKRLAIGNSPQWHISASPPHLPSEQEVTRRNDLDFSHEDLLLTSDWVLQPVLKGNVKVVSVETAEGWVNARFKKPNGWRWRIGKVPHKKR